MLLKRC